MEVIVGPFQVSVSPPWPVQIRIKGQGYENELRFTHEDFLHLRHIIEWAEREAMNKVKV